MFPHSFFSLSLLHPIALSNKPQTVILVLLLPMSSELALEIDRKTLKYFYCLEGDLLLICGLNIFKLNIFKANVFKHGLNRSCFY